VVRDEAWLRDPLDRFVLADLEAAGLTPTPPLERAALIRRLSVDLVGLLPTPEEVAAFEADDAPDALERLVDRLLGSPAFAERWGRHWLDLMRYAETRGHEFDYPIANAWRYRDYVLSALDQDVPYDRFLSEHVAGDLLPQPRPHPIEGWNESPLGTAFWGLGEEVHSPVDIRGDELERLDDKIDVFGKAFLGLTISCARCHDHKFDAISTRDYYALEGYLTSSRTHLLRFQTDEREQRVADWIESLRGEAAEALDSALLPPAPEASAPAPDARLIHDWGNAARVIQDGWSFTSGCPLPPRSTSRPSTGCRWSTTSANPPGVTGTPRVARCTRPRSSRRAARCTCWCAAPSTSSSASTAIAWCTGRCTSSPPNVTAARKPRRAWAPTSAGAGSRSTSASTWASASTWS
jgi:hypothetical protein